METVMNVVQAVRNFEGIEEKMKKLKRKWEHLKSREEDVKEDLEYAEGLLLKKRRNVVEDWLTNVASIENEVEQMEQQVGEGGLLSHLQLERKMKRLTEEVTELIHRGDQFPEGLTLEAHDGDQKIELITTKLTGQKFQQDKDKIWEGLMSDDVSKIGVWGMGGVGKTTLLTHIQNEIHAHQDFSVSWVTVTQNFSIWKLQSDIANAIGFQIKNDGDERLRAAEVAQRLRNMNNFVLILDDVWQHFSLNTVGIPTGGNGCKLILTSRSFDVCRRIGCEEYIKVEPLSKKEAWELFTEKLGHGRALSPEIEPIAISLTEKCCGLPLAIITVAGSMRGVEDIAEWRDALEKLKESVLAEHDDDMGIEVFKVLKYSYDQLKDPKVQQCFLYCSLFPEDHQIERATLIEHFIDERFVDGLRSRQAELNRAHTILNKLENVCLLEGCMDKYNGRRKCVKMHDLVRSMAIQIGRIDFRYLVESGEQLREIPGEEKWAKGLTRVSLMWNNISYIPLSSASPKCPRLSTLLLNDNTFLRGNSDCIFSHMPHLNDNTFLRGIPDCFFSHMPQLSVLNLSDTRIQYLPTSICELVNLTALWLVGCRGLKYVPSLENIKALRRLNLKYTDITEVPQGMEMLLNLRYLNLEETRIEMIPYGILPKLSCLQYLGMERGFGRVFIPRPRKVRGEEIVKLRKLETFKGYLNDMEDFNKYVRWRENNGGPNNYLYLVGLSDESFFPHLEEDDFEGYERGVRLEECKISSKSKLGGEDSDSLAVLPTDVQSLYIRECNDASSLCDIASLNNAIQLSQCIIHRCQGIEYVVCCCCCCSCNLPLIQSLVSLQMKYLRELRALIGREICCASASASASASSSKLLQTPMFSSLNEFTISGCPKIKRLFMPVLLPNLKNLVKLTVSFCKNMVEIIGEASDEDEDDENQEAVSTTTSIISAPALPKLSYLKLMDLPELKRFCAKEIVFDTLKEIQLYGCPKLSFNGVRHVEISDHVFDYYIHTYSVVNSVIGERIRY